MAGRPVVPVVDAVAIKVRLRDLSPILRGIAAGVGLVIKPFRADVLPGRATPLLPRRVDAAQCAVDGVTELVHANAFVVVTVDGQTEQILLAETGWIPARAADPFILKSRIRMVSILRHVGINLVLADDDQISAIADHGLQSVWPARQNVRNDLICALQREVRHIAVRGDRHALNIEVLFVEAAVESHFRGDFFGAQRFPVFATPEPAWVRNTFLDHFEERLGRSLDLWCVNLYVRRIHRWWESALGLRGGSEGQSPPEQPSNNRGAYLCSHCLDPPLRSGGATLRRFLTK